MVANPRKYVRIIVLVLALTLFTAYLPAIVKVGEDMLSHKEEAPMAPPVIEKVPVYVPSAIPLGNDTETYGDVRMFRMVEEITYDARITTKGNGRAATPEEFAEFCNAFKASRIETKATRGLAAVSDVFWKKTNVWAGFVTTNKDRTFILVLVKVGDSPVFAKVDVLSDDPAKEWKVWQAEDEDTEDTIAGSAFQVYLGVGDDVLSFSAPPSWNAFVLRETRANSY